MITRYNLEDLRYTPEKPEWFYSYIEIEHLSYLQNELCAIKKLLDIPNFRTNPHYVNIYAKHIKKQNSFFLNEFLTKIKLRKNFQRILFSTYSNDQLVAHVDGYINDSRCYQAINIPLIDCENSYTCFYTTNNDKLIFNEKNVAHYAWLPLKELKEIIRVEVVRPMIVNTTILHSAEIKNKNRMIASIRFDKKLTHEDMINLGIKRPFVQEY